MRLAACIATLCAALSSAAGVRAESLGTIGPTYPIAEQNLLDLIMARLREKERSGELQRMEELAKARATQSITSPKPVPGLRRADTGRTYYYDPTFTLDRNITDENGQLLFPAGMKVNPLDVVSLSKHLLFFDARDPRQVARAKDLIETNQGRVKAILVGGSYLELIKAWNRQVFYDQDGALVRRLGITAVPAIVSQEGSRLRIDEVAIK